MEQAIEIVDVHAGNLDQTGFFCYMSKKGTPGYSQKRDWLLERFSEGMQLRMIREVGGRTVGFIEYIPAEYAWRSVHCPGYLVIHCLWVVGKAKGKGYGTRLLDLCIQDARSQGKHGVAVVASDRVWMAKKHIFLKYGFEEVAQAPPSFRLLVYRFQSSSPLPVFPSDWQERQSRFGQGLVVVYTAQCPYIQDAVDKVLSGSEAAGIPARVVVLNTAKEVQDLSPSPYGVFGIVLDGKLLSYHYILPEDFAKLIASRP